MRGDFFFFLVELRGDFEHSEVYSFRITIDNLILKISGERVIQTPILLMLLNFKVLDKLLLVKWYGKL